MPLAASERELAECSGVVVALALPALDANATRADAALASQWDNFGPRGPISAQGWFCDRRKAEHAYFSATRAAPCIQIVRWCVASIRWGDTCVPTTKKRSFILSRIHIRAERSLVPALSANS